MQANILNKSETWVILASMLKRLEGTNTELLQLIIGKIVRQLGYGTWETPGSEAVQEAAGTQSEKMYIEKRRVTVAQWVALRPLFEVFTMETGYIGGCAGGRHGGINRQQKNNFGPPWKNRGNQKGGG